MIPVRGSLLENTFYWIDPRRGVCAVLLMQLPP
jgi:hypothetical protein